MLFPRLEEFEQLQVQAMEKMSANLKGPWKDAVRRILLQGLSGVGKGFPFS